MWRCRSREIGREGGERDFDELSFRFFLWMLEVRERDEEDL